MEELILRILSDPTGAAVIIIIFIALPVVTLWTNFTSGRQLSQMMSLNRDLVKVQDNQAVRAAKLEERQTALLQSISEFSEAISAGVNALRKSAEEQRALISVLNETLHELRAGQGGIRQHTTVQLQETEARLVQEITGLYRLIEALEAKQVSREDLTPIIERLDTVVEMLSAIHGQSPPARDAPAAQELPPAPAGAEASRGEGEKGA